MRFLCDEMLVRLARLLRAAGYDTYLASNAEPTEHPGWEQRAVGFAA